MFDGVSTSVLSMALLMTLLALAGALLWGWWRGIRGKETTIATIIGQQMPMSEIVVYKLAAKEIVTEKDHIFGAVGRNYLAWLVTERKLIMVFDLDIEFRYDLSKANVSGTSGAARIVLPPCRQEILLRKVHFYDESGGEILPWLLPGALAKMGSGISTEQRNALMTMAHEKAGELAIGQAGRLEGEIQKSAKTMLTLMASNNSNRQVTVEFNGAPANRNITLAAEVLALPKAA